MSNKKTIDSIDEPLELCLYSTTAFNAICEILKGQTAVQPLSSESCHGQSVIHALQMS